MMTYISHISDFYKTNWICTSPQHVEGIPLYYVPDRSLVTLPMNNEKGWHCPNDCMCKILNDRNVSIECNLGTFKDMQATLEWTNIYDVFQLQKIMIRFRTEALLVVNALLICSLVAIGAYYLSMCKQYIGEQYYLHSKRRLFHTDEVPDAEIDYDIFVSFSDADYDWVTTELVRHLEPKFKLCIHDRDFMAGTSISKNISSAISHSRRMIVVMSKGYHSSSFCLMEFLEGYLKTQHKSNYIIMVIKDGIRFRLTNKKVLDYISSYTYILESDTWLWEKVAYALPEKPLSFYRHQAMSHKRPTRQDLVGYTPEESQTSEETHTLQNERMSSIVANISLASRNRMYISLVLLAVILFMIIAFNIYVAFLPGNIKRYVH